MIMKKIIYAFLAVILGMIMANLVSVAFEMCYDFGSKLGATEQEKLLFGRSFGGIEILLAMMFVVIPAMWNFIGVFAKTSLVVACSVFLVLSFTSGFGMFIGNKVDLATSLKADADKVSKSTKEIASFEADIARKKLDITNKNSFISDKLQKIDVANEKLLELGGVGSKAFYEKLAQERHCTNYSSAKCVEVRDELNKSIKVKGLKESIILHNSHIALAKNDLEKLYSELSVLEDQKKAASIVVDDKSGQASEDTQVATFSKISGATNHAVLMALGVLVAIAIQFASIVSAYFFVHFSALFIALFDEGQEQNDFVVGSEKPETFVPENPAIAQDDILKRAMASVELSESQDGVVPMQPDADVQADKMVSMLENAQGGLVAADVNISKFIDLGTQQSTEYMTVEQFYADYKNWCDFTNQSFLTENLFYKALEFVVAKFNHVSLHDRAGVQWISGLTALTLVERAVA